MFIDSRVGMHTLPGVERRSATVRHKILGWRQKTIIDNSEPIVIISSYSNNI